jgi:hypothetical protein
VQITTPKTLAKQHGGDCEGRCERYPTVEVQVTPDWAKYRLPFETFKGPKKGDFPAIIMSMDIKSKGRFEVWVDEIRFYQGSPAAGFSSAIR